MTLYPKGICPACLRMKYAKQRENTTQTAMVRVLIQDPQSNFSPTTASLFGLQQITYVFSNALFLLHKTEPKVWGFYLLERI